MSKKNKKKLSAILTPEQKEKFKSFGEPDLSQNWLEIFTDDMISDLFTIMRSCSDNQRKSDYVSRELADYGFVDVGLGTNVMAMSHPYYPGVVFKIALDDYGIADNFNDDVLSQYVPRYNRVFARHPSALISVQERLVLPTQNQMDMFMPRILKILKELSKYFLIADLSPDMFLNYGVTRDGDFRFIDASDLYPLQQMKKEPRCNRITGEHKHTGAFKYCEGKLKYSDDFKYLICEKCGKEFLPLEFRPRKDVERLSKILSDGYNAEERKAMEEEELQAICARMGSPIHNTDGDTKADLIAATRTIFVDAEDDEDETELEEDQSESGREGPEVYETAEEPETDSEEEEDEEGPRTVFVNDEDDDTDDGFVQLRPRSVSLPMTSATEPDVAEHHPEADDPADVDDEDEEPETADNTSNEISADDADHSQETSVDSSPENTGSIISKVAPKDLDDTKAFLAMMSYCKNDSNDQEQAVYRGFISYVRKAMNTAVEEAMREDKNKKIVDGMTHCTLGEAAKEFCRKLFDSADPKDHAVLMEIVDLYTVQNESDNKNNTEESDHVDPLSPHIRYRIVNDDGDETSDVIPGIFLDITGDFDEAYDESGLPIYVSIDGGKTSYLALEAYKIKNMIEETVNDALVETTLLGNRSSDTPDETEEPTDED